jgi:hypothetical protein
MVISGTFFLRTALAALLVLIGSAVVAAAGGSCAGVAISCDNGRTYALCPIAVSDAGEIATAYLMLSSRHSAYLRLVPMGVGYRYSGRDIWLDGVRDDAILNFGNNRSTACTIANNK